MPAGCPAGVCFSTTEKKGGGEKRGGDGASPRLVSRAAFAEAREVEGFASAVASGVHAASAHFINRPSCSRRLRCVGRGHARFAALALTARLGHDCGPKTHEGRHAAGNRYFFLEKAASNAAWLGAKSNSRTNSQLSVAPWMRSMRPSSHSTESGPR